MEGSNAPAQPAEPLIEAPPASELTAADIIPPEITAQSLGEYFRAYAVRVRGGDAGVLPVAFALIILFAVFQLANPLFLTSSNLVNLFVQSMVFIVLAMSEAFVLLLGEIDLSTGYVGAIGGIIAANLVQTNMGYPWWVAILAGLIVTAVIGAIQGSIITRLGLPSFVVTLAGYLLWYGVMIVILGSAGEVNISGIQHDQKVLYGIVNNNIPPIIGWIGLLVLVVALGGAMWFGDASRRRKGLVAAPASLTALKIALLAIAGVVVVAICNLNRASKLSSVTIEGVPYVVPIVLVVLAIWTLLLERTAFGRHIYAVGGNAEAARRAGINVSMVRTICFILCSLTAGIAGVLYLSWQGGMTTGINGGQLVLYAVAAAVIGGTSLFGGRGRMIHGLLGGLVIGTIYNGLYLLNFQVQQQLIVTGLVLLAAVTIDSLSRRGARS